MREQRSAGVSLPARLRGPRSRALRFASIFSMACKDQAVTMAFRETNPNILGPYMGLGGSHWRDNDDKAKKKQQKSVIAPPIITSNDTWAVSGNGGSDTHFAPLSKSSVSGSSTFLPPYDMWGLKNSLGSDKTFALASMASHTAASGEADDDTNNITFDSRVLLPFDIYEDREDEETTQGENASRAGSVFSEKEERMPSPRRLDYARAVRSNLVVKEEQKKPPVKPGYDIKGIVGSRKPKNTSDWAILISNIVDDPKIPAEEKAAKGEAVLRYLLQECNAGRSEIRPDGGMYNKVMHAYAVFGGAEQAEKIFTLMCEVYEKGDELAEPNVKHLTTVIYAWQKKNVPEGPLECEKMLLKMHDLCDAGIFPKACRPDAYAYTSVLHCWADSGRNDAPVRAELLFRKMKDRFDAGDNLLRPDNILYSNLMNAAMSQEGGYIQAEAILWEMVDDYLNGNRSCKPKIRNLNTIIAAWSKLPLVHAAEHAEQIVERWMEVMEKTELDVKPDNYTFCLVLKSWASSTRPDAPQRLLHALNWMKEVSQNKGFSAAKIDSVKISTCVHAWVKFKHYRFAYDLLTETATDFINRKNELYPEYVLFAKVIESLCRVGNVERAEELLRLYWKAFESTPRRRSRPPAIVSCKTILDAWCALDRPDMAEAFLLQMDSLHQTGKITEKTDSEMFEKVVHAWEKSKFHDKYSHARSLKNTMRRRFGNIWNGPKKSMARHLFNK